MGNDANYAASVTAALGGKLAKAGGEMEGAIDMGATNKITRLATPTDLYDAATKKYVDDQAANYDINGAASSAQLAAESTAANALSSHNDETMGVHGITNTAALTTSDQVAASIESAIGTHASETENVHGIGDMTLLATRSYADDAVETAIATEVTDRNSAISTAIGEEVNDRNSAIGTHNSETTNVHGIDDTADLATKTYADLAVSTAVAALTKTSVGLENVDNTSDEDKPVSTATQTALSLKANLDSPTFTGTVTLPANTISQSMMGDDSVGTNEIGGLAVTEGKIASSAVTEGKIADGAVTSAKIADGTILNADINASAAIAQSKIADLTTDLAAKASLSGATFTGDVTLHADPSSALHAATKQYVDNTASGVVAKPQVLGATTANIDATYDNGTAGVGATLTHNTNGAFPAQAGGASGWALGKGILVKNQTNKAENGRYYVSDMGSASTPYVLTRCGYCDEANEIPGAYIFVQDGTLAGTGWIQTVSDPATFVVGTDNIDVFQFSGSGTITAGTNISVNGNEVSTVTNPVFNSATIGDVSNTELQYLNGVTSAVQTQLDAKLASSTASSTYETITNVNLKAPKADPTFTGTVTVSASGIAFTDGSQTKAGVPSLTTIATATTGAYNLSTGGLGLRDQLIPIGGTHAITVPTNATTAFPVGASISFYQSAGTGGSFVPADVSVTILATPGATLRALSSSATLTKVATNTWLLVGDLKA